MKLQVQLVQKRVRTEVVCPGNLLGCCSPRGKGCCGVSLLRWGRMQLQLQSQLQQPLPVDPLAEAVTVAAAVVGRGGFC